MNSSQGSAYLGSKRILKDTIGPTTLYASGQYDRISESSSTKELSTADEHALRTSFRDQVKLQVEDDISTDDESVQRPPVHVYTSQGDVELHTPDSTASSTKRMMLGNSGRNDVVFSVGKLQENYEQSKGKSGLDKTMREVLRKQMSEESTTTTTGETPNNNVYLVGDPYTAPNGMQMNNIERSNAQTKKPGSMYSVSGCLKFMAFAMIVMALIAGIAVLVYFKRNDSGSASPLGGVMTTGPPIAATTSPEVQTCPEVEVKLKEKITIQCFPIQWLQHLSYIILDPPPYVNEGESYNISKLDQNADLDWQSEVQTGIELLTLRGPAATCSSSGSYKLHLYDTWNRPIESKMVQISVLSELKKVNITLNQTIGNDTDYTIGCSTNSGCEQSFVDFFAKINEDEEEYLRGVNFSCVIQYNDYTGYSVSCVGVIPDFLLNQFEKITCRPRSSLIDDLDKDEIKELESEIALPECDLADNCGYKCTANIEDYFAVDPNRCDILHRCVNGRVYTQFCAPGTFFDPAQCSCRHTTDLSWCREDGLLFPGSDVSDKICET